MKITRDKIERLTFVKFLHYQAGQQKELERPLSSSAILTIHDCIECFLQLCYEEKTGKAKKSSQNILDTYSEELNKVFLEEENETINKSFIKRINDLRNQLKHATIFVDNRQIPNLYAESEIFLNDFTSQVFKLEFDKLSLIHFLSEGEIKTYLLQSENLIANNKLQEAMWSIGKAFYELLNSLNRFENENGYDIESKHQRSNYLIKYEASMGGKEPDSVLKENLKEIAEDINNLHSELYNLKTTLNLSVDLKEFTFFKHNMPTVRKIIKGDTGKTEFWIPDQERENIIEYDLRIVEKCLNFTINLAMKKE